MSAPGLTLLHRADLGLVIARWQRDTTPAELRHDYLAIRAVADEAACGHWLLDLRRRDDVTEPTINEWVGREFVPSLCGRYAAPARLAFLVSPLRAQQPVAAGAAVSVGAGVTLGLGATVGAGTTVAVAGADCLIATFTEEAAAYDWLTAD